MENLLHPSGRNTVPSLSFAAAVATDAVVTPYLPIVAITILIVVLLLVRSRVVVTPDRKTG